MWSARDEARYSVHTCVKMVKELTKWNINMSADWRMEIMDSIQNQVNIIKSFHKTHQRMWKYNPCSHMHIWPDLSNTFAIMCEIFWWQYDRYRGSRPGPLNRDMTVTRLGSQIVEKDQQHLQQCVRRSRWWSSKLQHDVVLPRWSKKRAKG